jgi:hypothetical protein
MGRLGVDTACRVRADAGGGAGARKQTEHEQRQQLMKTLQHSSRWLGVAPETIYLTGGASQNDGIAQTVAKKNGMHKARNMPSSLKVSLP